MLVHVLGNLTQRLILKYMKTFLLGVILVGVVVTIAQLVPVDSDSTYVREDTVEVIEAEPEAWMVDEDAVKAAQDVIRKKALETELVELNKSFASSTEAYEAEKKSYNEKKTNLEKSLGTY